MKNSQNINSTELNQGKVYQQITETVHESFHYGKYPLSINFPRYSIYNIEAFSSWPTVLLFESIVWTAHVMVKEEQRSYVFHLFDLISTTELSDEICKKELKRFISLGIVTGSGHYENDFLDDESCTGYYELDFDRIVQLLPYLLEQPRDTSEAKRYKKIKKYFKNMRNNLREFLKDGV